jgi:hypothetical protein
LKGRNHENNKSNFKKHRSGSVFVKSGLKFVLIKCGLMFCAFGLVFGGTEGVRSRFHILRSRTHFRRYRGRRVPFSCFALSNSFSSVPRASGPVFIFCAPELVFSGTEGAETRFHVLRFQTRFGQYRGCRIPLICFALPD